MKNGYIKKRIKLFVGSITINHNGINKVPYVCMKPVLREDYIVMRKPAQKEVNDKNVVFPRINRHIYVSCASPSVGGRRLWLEPENDMLRRFHWIQLKSYLSGFQPIKMREMLRSPESHSRSDPTTTPRQIMMTVPDESQGNKFSLDFQRFYGFQLKIMRCLIISKSNQNKFTF